MGHPTPANSADWPAIRALLEACHLPLEGAREHICNFLVLREANTIRACAGYEDYGQSILLRSVAVAQSSRGTGIGCLLVDSILEQAGRRGAEKAVLLTTTAADYFSRWGFQAIARDAVPAEVKISLEFRGACPASATAMLLYLNASSRTPRS